MIDDGALLVIGWAVVWLENQYCGSTSWVLMSRLCLQMTSAAEYGNAHIPNIFYFIFCIAGGSGYMLFMFIYVSLLKPLVEDLTLRPCTTYILYALYYYP